MSAPYSWDLKCEWCPFSIRVGPRGGRGRDRGAGVEAATRMEAHVVGAHAKTWKEYLGVSSRSET